MPHEALPHGPDKHQTPLHAAIVGNHMDVVQFLLQVRASVTEHTCILRCTPTHSTGGARLITAWL